MTRDEFIKHCNDFNKVLLEATEEGLLDDLQDDIEQGTINSVCDGVEELSLLEYSYNIGTPDAEVRSGYLSHPNFHCCHSEHVLYVLRRSFPDLKFSFEIKDIYSKTGNIRILNSHYKQERNEEIQKVIELEIRLSRDKIMVFNHLGSNQIPAAIEGGVDDLDR